MPSPTSVAECDSEFRDTTIKLDAERHRDSGTVTVLRDKTILAIDNATAPNAWKPSSLIYDLEISCALKPHGC